jgi:DNA invertase Pin-like site-specific DNA recombinase
MIFTRTNEGRVRAKARGIRFGRKPKLTKHQQAEALARIAQGETLTAIARSSNVSHMTISRLAGVTLMQSGRTNSAPVTKYSRVEVSFRYPGAILNFSLIC